MRIVLYRQPAARLPCGVATDSRKSFSAMRRVYSADWFPEISPGAEPMPEIEAAGEP
jgi:hypothetical protein